MTSPFPHTTAAKVCVQTTLQPGDRVAVMSRTRYEWTLIEMAILAAGGVLVPIYDTSSAEQVRWVLEDSGAVLVIAEYVAVLILDFAIVGAGGGFFHAANVTMTRGIALPESERTVETVAAGATLRPVTIEADSRTWPSMSSAASGSSSQPISRGS